MMHTSSKIFYSGISCLAFSVFIQTTSLAQQIVNGADAALDANGQADGVLFETDHILTIPDNTNINENQNSIGVATDASAQGTLDFEGNGLVYGTIWDTTNYLGSIFIDGDDSSVTFKGDTFTSRFNVLNDSSTSSLSLLAESNFTMLGLSNSTVNSLSLVSNSASVNGTTNFSVTNNFTITNIDNSSDLSIILAGDDSSAPSAINYTIGNHLEISDIQTTGGNLFLSLAQLGKNSTADDSHISYTIGEDLLITDISGGETIELAGIYDVANVEGGSIISFDIGNNMEVSFLANDVQNIYTANFAGSDNAQILFNIGNDFIISDNSANSGNSIEFGGNHDTNNASVTYTIGNDLIVTYLDGGYDIYAINENSTGTAVTYNIGNDFYLEDIVTGQEIYFSNVNSENAEINFAIAGNLEHGSGVAIPIMLQNDSASSGSSVNFTIAGDVLADFDDIGLDFVFDNQGDANDNNIYFTVEGNVAANTITMDGTSSPVFSIGGDAIINDVTAATDGIGIVSFTGSNTNATDITNGLGTIGGNNLEAVQFYGNSLVNFDIAANNILIGNGSNTGSAIYATDQVVQGNIQVNNGGTLTLNQANINSTGALSSSLNLAEGGTLQYVMSNTDPKSLNVTGVATLASDSIIDVEITGLTEGEAFTTTIINADGGATDNGVQLTTPSLFDTITGSVVNNTEYQITFTNDVLNFADLALTPNSQRAAEAFDIISESATGDAADVINAIENASSTTELEAILQEHVGALRVSSNNVTLLTQNSTLNLIDDHLDSLRSSSPWQSYTGMATGNRSPHYQGWAKIFGNTVDQDRRDQVDGFDADSYGIVAGFDTQPQENSLIGVSLAYSNTEIDASPTTATQADELDIDSYYANIYGSYQFANAVNLEGVAGFMYNNYDSNRYITAGASQRLQGDYDGQQYTAKLSVNRDIMLPYNTIFTPIAALQYTHIRQEGYTETGGDGTLNQTISDSDANVFQSGLGFSFAYNNHPRLKPEFRAMWWHDFIGDEQEVVAQIGGIAGPRFRIQGAEAARDRLETGLDLTYQAGNGMDIILGYDFHYQEQQTAHAGSIKLSIPF